MIDSNISELRITVTFILNFKKQFKEKQDYLLFDFFVLIPELKFYIPFR